MPTSVGKYPPGAPPDQQDKLLQAIDAIQTETGVTIPESMMIDLVEATRSGNVTYESLCEYMDRQISKRVLGQTLTTEPSERGTYSLGRVHLTVREDIVRQDAAALMALVNGQLIPWIVDLNFPPATRRYPRFVLKPPIDDDLRLQLEIDRFFTEQGLKPDETELYERYGRGTGGAATSTESPGEAGKMPPERAGMLSGERR